jgi:hypothetical protein
MKTYLLLPAAFLSFSSVTTSQIALQKNKEISISVGAASTMIKNYNLEHDKSITINNKISGDFSVEFTKYFLDRIGVGIGLGYSNYNQAYYQKGLFKQADQVDRDGRRYEKWINSDLKNTNKLSYSNVPVTIHFLLGDLLRCYSFIDIGIINQFLIKGTYTQSGTIETIAKYPSESGDPNWFGITMNNDYYNIGSSQVNTKNTEKYRLYNLSGHVGIGIATEMTKSIHLKVQPFMNIGFLDITGKNEGGKEYEDVLGKKSAYKPTKLYSAGFNIGLAFDL